MKKIMVVLLIILTVFTMTACNRQGSKKPEDGKKHITIAYTFEQLTEGMTVAVNQMTAQIEAFNASQTEYFVNPLVVYSADYELQNQINAIEDIIIQKYDVLILQAMDNNAVIPYLKKAYDAGIIVIDAQGDMPGDFIIHVLACDHYSQGLVLKQAIKERLEKNPNLKLNVGISWHDASVTAAIPRMYGLRELSEEMPDRVKIIPGCEIYTSETAVAQNAMEDWLQAHPEINYVGCSFDEPALGIINAIKAAGIKPGVIEVGSVDGSKTGCDLLAEGYMTDLVGISPREIAEVKMQVCFDAIQGKIKPGELIKGTFMVLLNDYTPSQIDDFLRKEGWL
jgi:ABC-type sugar transport system substrate-binding protein